MSWSIIKAGKAAEVKDAFRKAAEETIGYSNTPAVEKAILLGAMTVVDAQCDAAGPRTVIAESNGSADSAGNSNSTLVVRALYEH